MKNNIDPTRLLCLEILTIDPGKSNGAIAKYSEDRLETWNLNKFQDFDDLNDFFRYQKEICKLPLCFMEKITMYNPDIANLGRMHRLNKLKDHYVELRTAIRSAGIPFIEIMPYAWQTFLNVHITGEDYKVRKRRYKDIAEDWYNQIKVTLNNADAILLVEFARRKLKYDSLYIQKNLNKPRERKIIFK